MSKIRILIVDEEADSARGIACHLERTGYACVGTAARGADAIELAERLRPDLVLMDVELAGPLDGVAAATQIRERLQIPVVFMASAADQDILERARRAEPFGYVVKSFEQRELQPAIEIALHKHRTEAALRRSEERFRRLFHGVRDAVLLADAGTGRIIEANAEAGRLFGCPREALVGRHQSELHPVEKRDMYRSIFKEYVAGSTALLTDAEILMADGRVVPVEINAGLVDLDDRPAVLGAFRDISARRAAEQSARDRQARLDAISRAAPAGIGVVIDRVMTEVNDHVSRMTGYAREELLGQSTRMLYPSDEEFEAVGMRKYGLIRDQGTGTLETRWRCRDGRTIDILMSSTPIVPGDLGSGVTFAAVDITESRRTKAELAQRNRVLEGLQRISGHLLEAGADADVFTPIADEVAAMLDVRYAAVMLHDAPRHLLRIVGLHGFELPAAAPREIPVHGTLSGRVLELGAPVVQAGTDARISMEVPALHTLEARAYAGVPLAVSGRVAGVLAIAHDHVRPAEALQVERLGSIAVHIAGMLERREARAAQLRSETELLAIYDHAPVIVCLLDEQARIIRANQMAARFAGLEPGQLNGAPGGEFISCLGSLENPEGCGFGPRCSSCTMRTTILDTLRTGEPHAQVEVTRTVAHPEGGREIHLLLSTARLDLDGRRRLLVVLDDITETQRLGEQLMRAQRMESIGTLASGIAHDLNNVLAPIVMSLGMLTDMVRDPAAQEMIATMQLAANRGADIVRQVLTFARGLGGERVQIQPRHMVQEIARIARETFPRSIDVHCDFARDLATILGDPTQVQQVLMNLCVNARDAMPRGGQLFIHAANTEIVPEDAMPRPRESGGQFVVFTVRDTGIGMTPAVRERIFDPFFTTKAVGQGTGLGLAVTLGIVERHGGAISLTSEPGAGTTFQVFMPAAQAGDEGEQQPRPEARLPRGRGETILVVDDEPSVRTAMAGMLTKAGFAPVVARDGGEALLRLAECHGPVSLLVTDLMMPGMDGLELIPRIRQARPGIPIIAMTGLGDDDVRTSARALGVDRILAKPFSNAALLWTVSELIESQPAPRT